MSPRTSGDREFGQPCVKAHVCGFKIDCAGQITHTSLLQLCDSGMIGSLSLIALWSAVAARSGAPLFGAPFVVSFRLQMVDDDLVCRLALKH